MLFCYKHHLMSNVKLDILPKAWTSMKATLTRAVSTTANHVSLGMGQKGGRKRGLPAWRGPAWVSWRP